MSDTSANRMSGGPLLYIADEDVSTPNGELDALLDLSESTIDWDVNEVQTITPTGTVSGGTFTLEAVHPTTGLSETTSAIAYNADAATIKAALAALAMFTSSDLTVTGGGLDSAPVVITFGGAWANTNMPLLIVEDASITGGGTLATSETTKGAYWLEQPNVTGPVEVKPVYEADDHRPVHLMYRTGDTPKTIGIDTVSYEIEESDIDAHNIGLASTLKTTTSPGSGQVGYQELTGPGAYDIPTKQAALVFRGPVTGAWGMIRHIYRMRRQPDQPFTTDTGVRKIKIVWKVFARESDGKCDRWYEYTSPATS